MKLFEILYSCFRLFLPAGNYYINKSIKQLVKEKGREVNLLDVGGRKSHHTIGIPVKVIVTDLLRQSEIQSDLNLGVNQDIVKQLKTRRSNIGGYIIDDMVHTCINKSTFDIVIAVEVLEHVEMDELFINNIYNILKPGGIFFMTTPNGNHVKNINPDHKRHYGREHLCSLLENRFKYVKVKYAIKESLSYFNSIKSWSIKNPVRTLLAMLGSIVNRRQSGGLNIISQSKRTRHLFAIAIKE